MKDICNLEDMLKELKLQKRSFVLSGRNTEELDLKIKAIELKIESDLKSIKI